MCDALFVRSADANRPVNSGGQVRASLRLRAVNYYSLYCIVQA